MSINLSSPVPGILFGLTLSRDAGSATTVDVAAGVAADDGTNYFIQTTSTITKVLQSSGAWSAGTGGNGIDSGSRAASTWYHVFLIRADVDGHGDILLSTSVSSPTLPSGYTYKRRIGSILTSSSGNIVPFTQTGDLFLWFDAAYDVQAASVGTTSTLFTLSVPPGVKVEAFIRAGYGNSAALGQCAVRSPDEDSSQTTPLVTGSGHQLDNVSTSQGTTAELRVLTNTSRQVSIISNQTSNNTINIRTVGWIDQRGRLY